MKRSKIIIILAILSFGPLVMLSDQLTAQTPPPGTNITTSVTFDSDLDLTGFNFTGIVYTIGANDITIDGAGHKIIAPDAETVFYFYRVFHVTLKNFVVEADTEYCVTGWGMAEYILFQNLDIKGNGSGVAINIPIYSKHIQVLDCVISGWYTATYGGHITDVVLQGNKFTNNGVGISLGRGKYCKILENDLSNSHEWALGVSMDTDPSHYNGGDPLVIQDNDLTNSKNGIALSYTPDIGIRLSGIDFSSFNIVGIPMQLENSTGVTLSSMNFSNTAADLLGWGLVFRYCTGCILERCNVSGRVLGIYTPWSDCKVINSTITKNDYGVATYYSSFIEIRNAIIYANYTNDLSCDLSIATITYSDIGLLNYLPYVPDGGNINADPLFVDAANGDFRLSPGSPCIDTGDPDDPVPPGGGSRVDMGAYEAQLNQPPVAVCKNIEISADENCQATIVAEDVDSGSYDPDNDEITLSVDNLGPFALGEHYVNLTVTDEHGESDTCEAIVTVIDEIPPVVGISNPECVNVGKGKGKMANKLTVSTEDNCSEEIDLSIDKVEIYNKGGKLVKGKGVYEISGNDIYVYPNAKGWSIKVIATAVDECGNITTQTLNKSLIKCKK